MNEISVQLHSWLCMQRESLPLAVRADALLRALQACPEVRQAYFLRWQAGTAIYSHEGRAPHLPPGFGDPLQTSDQALWARLHAQPRLSLSELRQLPCWLAGRVRRAGLSHGQALALSLDDGQHDLLLLELHEHAGSDWLDLLHAMLQALLASLPQQARGSLLLGSDPQPSLLLDIDAKPRQLNAAMHEWLSAHNVPAVADLLPVNTAQLVRACLQQGRAIDGVEAQVVGQVLIWLFMPDPAEQQVLARCRVATAQVQTEREALKASRLYRLITENTTDLISRHTPDGHFLDASPASWTLLGFWPEALRGTPVQALFHEHDRQHLIDSTREALELDGYHTMTYRIRHRDGHYLWFETASRAIRETYTGTVVEVVSVSRDITARVLAEENKRRLAEVVEANTDLVLFIDPDGQLTHLNPSARHALNIDEQQALPALDQLLAQDDLQRLRNGGWHTADSQGVWSAEARLLPLGQRAPLPVSLVLLAHRGRDGEHYYSLVARDMTERELREAQQRRHQDELAHTARLVTLGELASGIAHEINQPLAAVVNYASASQRYLKALGSNPDAASKVAQGLERITEHANHASEVIKRLRAFLRKGQRRTQALDIASVAREAVRLCQWEASNWQVSIVEQLSDQLPPVYADRILIEQVLLNLLRNAIDANREAHPGQPSRIELRASEQAGQLCVQVWDQGPGVAQGELEHIFTPFYTSKAEGLGLGLSMSRSILEGFGGALEALPGADGGLCLECRLPLLRGEDAESADRG
ncbi:MAG: PAS domain-containing sensor histidine kinase [Pseudomonas sp.]|nr:PAS domain-containing sensor histidine kinase [Pseudomonas sp.]